ncbi:hypothetical protein LMG32289_00454 [Cupriavidus pampae]|uniref:Uncharacterized protein n=1 Tax=Cupriavidus pampae TaxID=659251 RepID=A0ABM8WA40_9BURK|nr:hypothetical protein LMG32289_00454 [Cupriavidus pampae]
MLAESMPTETNYASANPAKSALSHLTIMVHDQCNSTYLVLMHRNEALANIGVPGALE